MSTAFESFTNYKGSRMRVLVTWKLIIKTITQKYTSNQNVWLLPDLEALIKWHLSKQIETKNAISPVSAVLWIMKITAIKVFQVTLFFYFFFHVQLIRTECEFEAAFIRVDSLKFVECFIFSGLRISKLEHT